jgi:hypothetical protein
VFWLLAALEVDFFGSLPGRIGLAVLFLGLAVWFGISIAKACVHRSRGWIWSAIVSGVACLLLFLTTGGVALRTLIEKDRERLATMRARRAALAVPADGKLSSPDGAISLQVPPDWIKMPSIQVQGLIAAGSDADRRFVSVVAIYKKDYPRGSLERVAGAEYDNLAKSLDGFQGADSVQEPIGVYPAIRRRVEGTTRGSSPQKLVYQVTMVETQDAYYRISTFCDSAGESSAEPVLKKVTDSFTAVAGPPDAGKKGR